MTAIQPIATELTHIEGLVLRANTQVAAGYVCDLSNLDAAIQAVCHSIETLPAERAREIHARVLALYDELGHLAEKIQENLETLSDRLGDNTKRRHAASAYAKPPKR